MKKFDFITLVETFLDNHDDESVGLANIFPDHEIYSCPAIKLSAKGRRSGGVLVLVRESLSRFVKEITVPCDNLVVLLLSKSLSGEEHDTLFLSLYCQPIGSPFYHTHESDCHK